LWLLEAPVRKIILQMHTPARTSQCWSRQTQHGLGVCIWMHLVNGTGNSPSPGQPTPGVVKQDKSSGGSVDTTKTRSDPQRVRMSSGERPIGAAKGKQTNTMASYQPPPPGQQHTWLPCQSPLTLEHHGQLMSPLEPQSCLKNIAVTFMFRESPWSPEPCNTHGAVFCLAKCSALECPHRSATIGCAAFPDMRALHVNPLSSEGRRLGMSMLLSIPNFGGTLH